MRPRPIAQPLCLLPVKWRLLTLLAALGFGGSAMPHSLHAQTSERPKEAAPIPKANPVATNEAVLPKPLAEIHTGDRIAFIGSAVGQAIFQDAFLPSLLQAGLPEGKLTFVNLATPGQSLSPKNASVSGIAKLLQTAKADVVFAFFGAVEASAGENGLRAFRSDLSALLQSIRQQKSGAHGPLRLVLFGPPARERLMEPFSKEGARSDAMLKLYSEAMAGVAKEHAVGFFDLYTASTQIFATGPQRSALLPKRWGTPQSALTVNGGFLTAEANRLLAPMIFEALLARTPPELDRPETPPFGGDTGKSYEPLEIPLSSDKEIPFSVSKNLSAKLFASDAQFPPLILPVQLDVDAKGRLWVLSVSEKTNTARLLILEDLDGDAKADRCTVFADELPSDASFVLYRDGVLLSGAGDLWLLRDPSGSGKATEKRRLVSGLSPAGTSAPRTTMVVDPKGAVLLHDRPHAGFIETGLGSSDARGSIYRFEPATGRLEVVSNQANTDWTGSVLDVWGRDLFSAARGSWKTLWKQAPRGITSTLVVPDPISGNVGLQVCVQGDPAGIRTLHLKSEGTAISVQAAEDFVTSTQSGFSPLAQAFASDSALLFSEGTQSCGRIYRIDSANSPVEGGPRIGGQEIPALLECLRSLSHPGILQRTRNELASRPAAEVLDALSVWELGLSKKDPAYEMLRLQSLWLRRWFDKADLEASGPLLRELLKSAETQVRAEAVRMVRETRRILPDALILLEPLAKDPAAIVRFEVLAAAATFEAYDPAAVKLVHTILGLPLDAGLERLAKETLQRLEPDSSRMLVPTEAKALAFVLARLAPAELAKAPGVEAVWLAQVDRVGMAESVRESALQALAKAHRKGRATEIARAIGRVELSGAQGIALAEALCEMLLKSPVSELRAAEEAVEALASKAKLPKLRHSAYAAWVQGVLDVEGLWKRLEKTPNRQLELLAALPLVRETQVRARLRPALESVLQADSAASEALALSAVRAVPLTGASFGLRNFDLLASLIIRGRFVPEAAQAIVQLPEPTMGGENGKELGSLAPVISAITRWLEAVPEKERRSPQFAATLQAGRVLAHQLELETAAAARKLRETKSEVCVLRTVFEQGRFDTRLLSVRVGQPLELVFENADTVPRNLVLVAPGMRESVLSEAGKLAANQQDAEGRAFVPKHPGVLAATKLLALGEQQVLKFKAPEKAGKYELVCTAPGTPEGMRAILEVTER